MEKQLKAESEGDGKMARSRRSWKRRSIITTFDFGHFSWLGTFGGFIQWNTRLFVHWAHLTTPPHGRLFQGRSENQYRGGTWCRRTPHRWPLGSQGQLVLCSGVHFRVVEVGTVPYASLLNTSPPADMWSSAFIKSSKILELSDYHQHQFSQENEIFFLSLWHSTYLCTPLEL